VRNSLIAVSMFAIVAMGEACSNSSDGGASASGGAAARGGSNGSGGANTGAGGTSASGGTTSAGGSPGSGGSKETGGATSTGGAAATGGKTGSGGATSTAPLTGGAGGVSSDGGKAAGGATASGGTTGGATGTAGATGNGGATGSGGATTGAGGSSTGGAGGGTSAGGAGGAAADPVTPTKVSSKYQLAFGDVVFEVDPQVGARVSKLSLSSTDMVITTTTDNTTWGSVFWTSPRSSWTPKDWPPLTAIDNATYTGGISGNDLLFNGPTDTSMGLGITKDYRADATSGWITITYTINATKAVKAGPWEDTRVPRGGIVFFPAGTSLTKGPLTMTTTSGINWFDDASKSASSSDGSKAMADASGGWAAYAFGGVLFLKKYTDQPATALAPSEGEVDIYPGSGFLEFEVLGPYTSIAAGGNLPWTIQWRLVKIPSSVTVSVGSTSLVDFAKQQVGL
jgi:hypothetical protein